MGEVISDKLLKGLSELVQSRIGLLFPRERWNDLLRGIQSAKEAFGFEKVEDCIGWLLSTPLTKQQRETLASFLTIGETYFFRESQFFHALELHLLPEIIRANKQENPGLKVWSAGCCSGEEPYSIAILLKKIFSSHPSWKLKILGSDINPNYLEKASRGEYGKWSFREGLPTIKEEYFHQTESGGWKIIRPIHQMVTFFNLNLVEDSFPSTENDTDGCDIIFCRNVLMYFSPETIKKILEAFHRSLAPGGYLLVSATELSLLEKMPFSPQRFGPVTVFRKGDLKDHTMSHVPFFPLTPLDPWVPLILDTPSNTWFAPKEKEPALDVPIQPMAPTISPRSVYEVAEKLYQQGLYLQVVETLKSENLQTKEAAPEMNLLARALANLGKLDFAMEWCKKAIAWDRMNPGYHFLLATIFTEMNCSPDATASLNRAIYLDPGFVLAHISLGNLAKSQGKNAKATKHFQQALQILKTMPDDEILPFSEGLSCSKLRDMITLMTGRQKE
ncbi:MAG: CheR family methyltransferase [Candidatus Ozemobacteraceae bacterium]